MGIQAPLVRLLALGRLAESHLQCEFVLR